MSFVLSTAMQYLFQMINPLQIIFHLPALNLGIPSNAMAFFAIVVPIVNFDCLGEVPIWKKFLEAISTSKEDKQNNDNKQHRALGA